MDRANSSCFVSHGLVPRSSSMSAAMRGQFLVLRAEVRSRAVRKRWGCPHTWPTLCPNRTLPVSGRPDPTLYQASDSSNDASTTASAARPPFLQHTSRASVVWQQTLAVVAPRRHEFHHEHRIVAERLCTPSHTPRSAAPHGSRHCRGWHKTTVERKIVEHE